MTASSRPVSVRKLRGRVSRGDYAKGSKSERDAVFIDTNDGRYLLRRKGGPVFADDELERHVGRTVECDGFLVGSTLLADSIEQVG
jgi:hypothetical protein